MVVVVRSYSPRNGAMSLEQLTWTSGCVRRTTSATAFSWALLAMDQSRQTATDSTPLPTSRSTTSSIRRTSVSTSTDPL